MARTKVSTGYTRRPGTLLLKPCNHNRGLPLSANTTVGLYVFAGASLLKDVVNRIGIWRMTRREWFVQKGD
jgi:hypothetical protein